MRWSCGAIAWTTRDRKAVLIACQSAEPGSDPLRCVDKRLESTARRPGRRPCGPPGRLRQVRGARTVPPITLIPGR